MASGNGNVKRKTWLAICFFAVALLLLTRLDFFVNGPLYSYGLVFDWNWYTEYQVLYNLLWQFTIIVLTFYSRNLYFLAIAEAFHRSSTQDLFFFPLWTDGFPTGDWTWSSHYQVYGHWTTMDHIAYCLILNGLVIGVCLFWRTLAAPWFHKRFFEPKFEIKL